MSDSEGKVRLVARGIGLEETPQEILRAAELFKQRPEATIYRVPPEIPACDKKAYEPKAVCIGPFFYESRHSGALESMQAYKLDCLKKLISEHSPNDWEHMYNIILTKMEELEGDVRSKYSERFPLLDSLTFRKMLILDGCFLLRLLLRYADGAEKVEVDEDDARKAYGRLWIWNLVRYDLLLLQNQIPFFVIQKLYDLLMPENEKNLVHCAINFFSPLDPCRKQNQPKFYMPVEDVHHLLHLIYLSILPCPQYSKPSPMLQSRPSIPNAMELWLAGMKFKKRENEGGFLSFLDVKFSDGVMEIPEQKLHDYSIILFRNFIAFEQCYPDTQCHVTVYAAFMGFLINIEKDVTLLCRKDILINIDKDATHFLSNLCNEVHHAGDKNYLRKLLSDVNEHHDSRWRKWRAELFRVYFSSPKMAIAIFGLYLNAIGTTYNVLSKSCWINVPIKWPNLS